MRLISFVRSLSVAFLALALVSEVQAQGAKARAVAREKIQETFLNVLGREATEKDIEHHLKLLENRQYTPLEMRKSIVLSEEGIAAVNAVFKKETGRDPTPQELMKAQTGLNEGHSLDDLRHLLRKR